MFAKRFFSTTSPSFTEPEIKIKFNLKEILQDYETRNNRYQDAMKESLNESLQDRQKYLIESLQERQKDLIESLQESQKYLIESLLQESQKELKVCFSL